jgi:hypothetical protein
MPMVRSRTAKFVHENALSLVALALFAATLTGQAICGFIVAGDQAREHGAPVPSVATYLTSGDFIEVTFENWESEFLQMALFVILTKYLHQKGSSESKPFDEPEPASDDPRKHRRDATAPWPVRRGGLVLRLYERSFSIALSLLFALSFVLHGIGGASKFNEERIRHGEEAISTLRYFATSQFWFESFQNWQSEFLSVAALVLLSIVLRERGSPQSKPVAAPHAQTGES